MLPIRLYDYQQQTPPKQPEVFPGPLPPVQPAPAPEREAPATVAMGTRADRTVFCNNFSNAMLETDFVQLLAGAAVQVGLPGDGRKRGLQSAGCLVVYSITPGLHRVEPARGS